MEIRTVTVGKDKEQLLSDFEYKSIVVPAGFVFDGASAPRIFWSIIPPFKRTKKAACIHDYLCSVAEGPEYRLAADRCFRIMLKEAGLSSIRCWIGYLGVRLGAKLGIGIYYDK